MDKITNVEIEVKGWGDSRPWTDKKRKEEKAKPDKKKT